MTVVLTFVEVFMQIFISSAAGPIVSKSVPVYIDLFKEIIGKGLMFVGFKIQKLTAGISGVTTEPQMLTSTSEILKNFSIYEKRFLSGSEII